MRQLFAIDRVNQLLAASREMTLFVSRIERLQGQDQVCPGRVKASASVFNSGIHQPSQLCFGSFVSPHFAPAKTSIAETGVSSAMLQSSRFRKDSSR